ncbi:MAG: hypothetical protein HY785_11030 [Oscillatoriophycideae cyanobacterium NC_groundwater_1537_Pr4_S-0.65um_50_18]|nr:hypothetical protein [Oscillatoriophycideae cyanobacterium NC_groundwater_1537_Pr4_S-0.65um_50_18]
MVNSPERISIDRYLSELSNQTVLSHGESNRAVLNDKALSQTILRRSRPDPAADDSAIDYIAIKDLTSWLLWGIARSAYGAMRLLEGTPARILQPDQSWQTGILRLVAQLQVKAPALSHAFDLVTQQVAAEVLTDDRLIQLGDSMLYPQPTTIAEAVDLLRRQIQATTPALTDFLIGTQTELLMPQQPWQPATFYLSLGFEFTPAPPPPAAVLQPRLKFTDPVWIEQYQETIAHLEPVPEAEAAIDRLQTDLTLTSRNFLQQEWQTNELALRLLWCFSHSAYEVMQLMSGVAVSLLQPDRPWETGTLRLWIGLTVQTPELDWGMDLMTGHESGGFSAIAQPAEIAPEVTPEITQSNFAQPSEVTPTTVELNSVVRSPELPWLQQPALLEALEAQVQQHIAQTTPELLLLLQGTEVDLMDQDGEWQSGWMQLSIGFEFLADL